MFQNTTQILMAADAEFRSSDRLPEIKVYFSTNLIINLGNIRLKGGRRGQEIQYYGDNKRGKKGIPELLPD